MLPASAANKCWPAIPTSLSFSNSRGSTIHPGAFRATGIATIKSCLEKRGEPSGHGQSFCRSRSSQTALPRGAHCSPVSVLPPRPRSDFGGVLPSYFSTPDGGMVLRSSALPGVVDHADSDHCALRENLSRLRPRIWLSRDSPEAIGDRAGYIRIALSRRDDPSLRHAHEPVSA